jgi:rare lipoprotein A (peptidoglycan hydrolase)
VSRRAQAKVVVVLLASALAVPSLSWAGSGGAGIAAPAFGVARLASGIVQPGNVTATTTGGGVTVSARISAILSHRLHFTGTVDSPRQGQTVFIQRLDRAQGWLTIATPKVAPDGSFTAAWATNHIGRFAIRALLGQTGTASRRATADSSTLQVTVYRPSIATQFGGGFFGSRTACGQILGHNTLGVAHRWLPCGTPVAIYYGGRTIVVPVIDRGPYANHADWDLTEATGRALRMDGTQTIGAVSLPKSSVTAN